MKNFIILLLFIITCFFNAFTIPSAYAGKDFFTQKDREMIVRLDERLKQIDKRFEELRQDMNNRFELMQNLMIAIVGAFSAIVAVTIGFAIWDRRTMVRPFEDKVKKIEDDIVSDRKRLEALFDILRNYARKHPGLADVLKQFSIL